MYIRHKPSNHMWTEEEREIVRRDYAGTNTSADSIASKLGVTRWAVKGQCAKMGILQNKSPNWTGKEIALLCELLPQYSLAKVAKILHRSINAVSVKARRIHLSRRYRDGWYTKLDVMEILGVDHHKVQEWIDKGFLNASWHTERKPQARGMAMWHILETDLRDFIIHHSGKLLGRNVDLFAIVQILVPNGIDGREKEVKPMSRACVICGKNTNHYELHKGRHVPVHKDKCAQELKKKEV